MTEAAIAAIEGFQAGYVTIAGLADGRLAVLPGTHGLPVELPELVNTLLIAFLRGAAPASAWMQPSQ